MKMIAKGKPTFHVIWNLFSCKKLQIFLFPTYLQNPPLARKKNLPNPFLARRENANSWKLFEIGAGQQFVECWESGTAKFNLQFSLNSVPIQSSQWTEIESKYNSTCTMYDVQVQAVVQIFDLGEKADARSVQCSPHIWAAWARNSYERGSKIAPHCPCHSFALSTSAIPERRKVCQIREHLKICF